MGNNNLSTSENIHVKVDQNNIIFIDPNSVVDGTNVVSRNVQQENLMMFVNLEADLIERTILATSTDPNVQSSIVSIAKGMLNLMANAANGGSDFDTTWTEAFLSHTDIKDKDGKVINSFQNDSTAQSFGIDSININIKGANMIPQININFIDVRGKTLFESPKNSPYSAFFHLPWPIFYLTVKGYYGKAIKYRLHLVDFSTKYNESNGNFDIATTFVGSTYAYLNDIPLNGALEAAYLYPIEKNKETVTNDKTTTTTVTISKNSRGYQMLESVFEEYRQKGYVSPDFRTITLRELITKAGTLDKTIEESIFAGVNPKVFVGIKDFGKTLDEFEGAVKNWKSTNLEAAPTIIDGKNYYALKGQAKDKINLDIITGTTDTKQLNKIISNYLKELEKGKALIESTTDKGMKKMSFNYKNEILDIKQYIRQVDANYLVDIEGTTDLPTGILSHIYKMYASFIEQRNKFQNKIEELINQVTLDPSKGIGFKPTIGNVFAVLLANADVYIRLMKDVHVRAYEFAAKRNEKIGNLSSESKGNLNIYPWPQITKATTDTKQKVLMYPGDPDLYKILESNNPRLWPEVEFVENYAAVATKRVDSKADKEGGVGKVNIVFEKDEKFQNSKRISTLFQLWDVSPYTNKSISSILSEIWERSRYTTFLNSFNSNTITELANIEFENLKNNTQEDLDIIEILKTTVNITPQDRLNNVNDSYSKFIRYVQDFSPFERKPYFLDNLPTVPYIKTLVESSFKLEQYGDTTKFTNTNDSYKALSSNLVNYSVENYRKNIYPFNSSIYLDYINEKTPNLTLLDFLNVDTEDGLIGSPLGVVWNKSGYGNNMFSQKLNIKGNTNVQILNTPYFHKQLFNDFNQTNPYGKYVGSSYLLLNSLPFIELSDKVKKIVVSVTKQNTNVSGTNTNTLLSTMFKEVSASHSIPYHLIVKWGSLYHRYKKYTLEGIDIISGITDTIDTGVFYDNNDAMVSNNPTSGLNGIKIDGDYRYHDGTNIGIHPFYDDIFHQVINGYELYNYSSGLKSYEDNVSSNIIRNRRRTLQSVNYWSNFVDNSKLVETDNYYTLLPSDGSNLDSYLNTFNDSAKEEQNNFRILWYTGETIGFPFSGNTLPSPNQYMRTYVSGSTTDDNYGFGSDYKKIIDLIGTFSPDILDKFEEAFLEFASEKENVEIPYKRYSKVKYDNFQDLLKEIVTIGKTVTDKDNIEGLINDFLTKQKNKLENITYDILSEDNKLKLTLGNPRELDLYVIGGFCKLDQISFKYNPYDYATQSVNTKYIKLYIGEDIDGNYLNFFSVNNIELSEDNVKIFRPLAQIFAGGYKEGLFTNNEEFVQYLVDNIFSYSVQGVNGTTGYINRNRLFIETLIQKFSTLEKNQDLKDQISLYKGFGQEINKLEMYNSFKSFNDKWIAGNSIGQKLLIEEFLFLDKANRNIGDMAYINLNKLIGLDGKGDDSETIYSTIGTIIEGSNFMFRGLPSYTNFYGTTFSTKSKIDSSKNVAKNLFGTFLEVDYQESSPKMLLQYMGPTSKYLELEDIQDKMKFKNDSGNLFDSAASPLIITTNDIIKSNDYSKSNKVVAFEVSVGDQAQGMFKSIQLNQATMKNTFASQIVNENMGRSETGSGVYQVDVGLFDVWRQASYTCDVTMMGNVMIQPTMYFYLKNIPMFRGSYWISEVTHNIRNNSISTTFKGTRLPYASLPNPKESFMLSFRALFESVTNKAIAKINAENKDIQSKTNVAQQNEKTVTNSDGKSSVINMGPADKAITGEKLLSDSNVTSFGVPYNGYKGEKFIQKIEQGGKTYLRAQAVTMGGTNYPLSYDTEMSIINGMKSSDFSGGANLTFDPITGARNPNNRIIWDQMKNSSDYFFSIRFDKNTPISKIITYSPTFYNAKNMKLARGIALPFYQIIPTAKVIGAINSGPSTGNYGIGLSPQLMKDLGLHDGDVVYFTI